jgi:O-antigen/teichoic acid export membrane protein
MNSIQRIAKNIGFSGISQGMVSILSFIFLIYIARYLGEAQYGNYSFAISFTSLFIIFADIGISQLIIREIARDKEITSEYVTNVSIIKIILSFITFALIIITINLMNYPPYVTYVVYLFGIYTILYSFAQLFTSIFQAFEKMEYVAVVAIAEKIVIMVIGLYILSLGYGLLELAYVYVLAGIIEFIISLGISLKKITRIKPKINISLCKSLTIRSIPFGLNSLFAGLFFKMDTVLLSIFKDNVSVGIYNAAYNPLLSISVIISNTLIPIIYPLMSKDFESSNDSLDKYTIISSKYMAIIGFPIAVGCFVLADKFILLFYGGQYLGSIIAFQILALFMPIRLVSGITGTLLTSINKQGIRTFSVLLSASFNIILNLLLIPSLSFVGASIATVLSELFLYGVSLYLIDRYHHKIKLLNYYLRPFIASLLMGVLLFILKDLNLFLLVIMGAIFYFIILVILKTFTMQDKYLIKQILNK